MQHKWWEFDLSYYEIKLLERLGLASDVIPPRHLKDSQLKAASATSSRPMRVS